jgi:hypothetical protein
MWLGSGTAPEDQSGPGLCSYKPVRAHILPTRSEHSLFTDFLRTNLAALKTENDDGLL